MRRRDWDSFEILFTVTMAFLVIIIVMAAVVDCNKQNDCERNGGRVERHNHRTVFTPMSCGEGCVMVVPTEVSDWRCVDLPAERP